MNFLTVANDQFIVAAVLDKHLCRAWHHRQHHLIHIVTRNFKKFKKNLKSNLNEMFVCKKWLKLSNVCVPRWWDLRRYLQDINPVLLSVVLSVCLVCNSDLELVVNTVFSTMIIMSIIIRNVLMSKS